MRYVTTSVKMLTHIPKFSRIKQLASALCIDKSRLIKQFVFKHRKKLFCHFEGTWFEFPKAGDIIVPDTVIKAYLKLYSSNIDERQFEIISAPKCISAEHNRVPLVALLGHYDHGKTTLLDSLGGIHLVGLEKGGITQVF